MDFITKCYCRPGTVLATQNISRKQFESEQLGMYRTLPKKKEEKREGEGVENTFKKVSEVSTNLHCKDAGHGRDI